MLNMCRSARKTYTSVNICYPAITTRGYKNQQKTLLLNNIGTPWKAEPNILKSLMRPDGCMEDQPKITHHDKMTQCVFQRNAAGRAIRKVTTRFIGWQQRTSVKGKSVAMFYTKRKIIFEEQYIRFFFVAILSRHVLK